MDTTRVEKILDALEGLYPEAKAELHFSNPFETLIATILSAQCTDKRVNQVTEKLFPLYPDAKAMARLTPEELEPMIRECGLYHSKAKNIVAACRALVEQYDGQVPADRKKLMALPGVGQKTAGVVLMAAFGDDQIPVKVYVDYAETTLEHSNKLPVRIRNYPQYVVNVELVTDSVEYTIVKH